MRKKLHWVSELPRHGPGCRAAMEKLYEKPQKMEDEDDVGVGKFQQDYIMICTN